MNLKVNMSKTKIVVFRRGGRLSAREVWRWNDEVVLVINDYKYLGIPFTSKGAFCMAAEQAVIKSLRAVDATISLIKKIEFSIS